VWLTNEHWLSISADAIVAVLLLANILMIAAIFLRERRQRRRDRRTARFLPHVAGVRAALADQTVDAAAVRQELGSLDELEWPLVTDMLIEWLPGASDAERDHALEVTRALGGVERLVRQSGRGTAWRRAHAVTTLGALGADEAVPALLDRLSDRNRHVREASVVALGRIGDRRALGPLGGLVGAKRQVAPGLVYQALLGFGDDALPVFSHGMHSDDGHTRELSVIGFAAVSPSPLSTLVRMLEDAAGGVRAAAAEMLGQVGGEKVPEELSRASRDEERIVRRAAVSALASYDDAQSLQLALSALDDPDRDTALRAGETLVRLTRLPGVGGAAASAIRSNTSWPLQTVRLVSSLET
jgi:HEAT repeat protein